MDFIKSITFLVLTVLGLNTAYANKQPIPTPIDKFSILQREDVKFFKGVSSRGSSNGGFLTHESREFKCRILSTLYNNAEKSFGSKTEQKVLTERVRRMLETCPRGDFRIGDFFNQTFIFPGTKWCGQGNMAENYHDLGAFNETDACCRDHDFCDDIIQSGRTKHNLINPYGTTRLHCKCDEALRKCFREINSVISNTVGYIFFSLLQTQCFDFDYPSTGCALWRRGAVRLYCVKYATDETQPKKWQWFDQEPYF